MTDLFANMPPPDMTLEGAEQLVKSLRDRLDYIDHDLEHNKHLTRDRKWQLQAERYDKRKRLEQLQDWLDRGLI